MRKPIICLSAAVLLGGCVHNQPTAETDGFVQKLSLFGYSLYKDLKGMTFEELNALMRDGLGGHTIGVKCRAFYNESREQIRVYQRSILLKFTGPRQDLKDVVRDERFDGILANGPVSTFGLLEDLVESGEMKKEGKQVYKEKNWII
jgi:hypothetical protein